jgi:tetratricopeptide (TPR) repeat protein
MAVWESEYTMKKQDKVFLSDYITRRIKAGLPNSALFEEYLTLLPEEERTGKTILDLYKSEAFFLKANSLAFSNLIKHQDELARGLGSLSPYFQYGIMNTAREAAKSNNESLLDTVIQLYDQLPKKAVPMFREEIYLYYYQKSGETDKYLKTATDFGNNHLMKTAVDSITSEKERNKVGGSLNALAWDMFEKIADKNWLQDALKWSKQSVEIDPDNYQYLDTYANLLYKLGFKEEAIAKEEEALSLIGKKDAEAYKATEDVLRKMKAGEKTW